MSQPEHEQHDEHDRVIEKKEIICSRYLEEPYTIYQCAQD